ncbi:MAG: DUF2130 domain-containing protein [Pirellulales bacterium]|nr:DUF2130 domain-containing protein [Pirellulales bacterium]
MADTITCPKCNERIEVTEVMSAQLRAQLRGEFENEQRAREAEIAQREAVVKSQQEKIAAERAALEENVAEQVAERLKSAKQKLEADALVKAKESLALELQDAHAQLTDTRSKLVQAQQAELELRQQRRELEEQKKNLELETARRIDKERENIRTAVQREADEQHRLKDAEKDKRITDLAREIENLKRKAEQGSQQLQGEVLELDLESLLRTQFPVDEIRPVPKGVHGGDVVHLVRDTVGGECGIILWESKRTKNWSDGWLPKLRGDQRAAKAQVAILVSDELPKGVTTFAFIDEVWVTNRACSIGLALALRCGVLDAAKVRRAIDGQQDKMAVLYNYLSSTGFRNRVAGIVEAFVTMKTDLEVEKRAITKHWAKREKQIEQALGHTSSMYGDLQGIIGGSLQTIESLELTALPSPDDDLVNASDISTR